VTRSKQSAGRRLSVITIDQVIAGASNVLIAVLAARVLGVESFGLFGVVFLVYVTAQYVSRALVCEPLLVHPTEARERAGEVIGTASLLGLGIAGLVGLSALAAGLWDQRLAAGLFVLALCMPLLVLQDLGRFLGFATQRPSLAVTLDVTWLVVMVGAVAALFTTDARTLAWFIVAWAGPGAAAGVLLFWQHRGHRIRLNIGWLRETWPFASRYLLSYSATQGAALVGSIGLGVISGARALGAVRGALLLMRPFVTFQAAAIAGGVAEVSNSAPDRAGLRKHVRKTTVLTTAVGALNMVILLILPDQAGEAVLGDTWQATKSLLLPAGVQMVALGLISGVRSALLGQRAIRTAVRIDVAATVIVLAATLGGAVVNGALGAWWAVAVGQFVVAAIWWVVYLRRASERSLAAASAIGAAAEPPASGSLANENLA